MSHSSTDIFKHVGIHFISEQCQLLFATLELLQ